MKHNKKIFCKYIGTKREARENVGPLLNGVGGLVTKHVKKANVLSVFFALLFTAKTSIQESQCDSVTFDSEFKYVFLLFLLLWK